MPITLVRPSQINHVPVGANLIAVLAENNTETTISNNTTETQVFSLSIPGNTLGANDVLAFDLWGDMNNTTGGNVTPTFRIKLGGTTVVSLTFAVPTGTANAAVVRGVIKNQGATNAQKGDGILTITNNSTTQLGTATIDMTAAQTFVITVQLSVASVNASYIHRLTQLTYIPAT